MASSHVDLQISKEHVCGGVVLSPAIAMGDLDVSK